MANCFKYGLAASALGLALATTAGAQSISTLYATNNNGSAGGMVYFDVTVGSNALTITGFDVNTNATSPFGFQVYTVAGGFSGHETNSGDWTSMATGSSTGGIGTDTPTAVTLNNTFMLNANTTYGMAITLSGQEGVASHYYTNGDGTNQNFSNGDLSLSLGEASNVPFTAPLFSPRVWNGTIHYSAVPEPASMTVLGLGALALLRRRRAKK